MKGRDKGIRKQEKRKYKERRRKNWKEKERCGLIV